MEKSQIVYDDFAKVDFGPLGCKWPSAQITSHVADNLVGRLVSCVCRRALLHGFSRKFWLSSRAIPQLRSRS